jgi:hypothetical protein
MRKALPMWSTMIEEPFKQASRRLVRMSAFGSLGDKAGEVRLTFGVD